MNVDRYFDYEYRLECEDRQSRGGYVHSLTREVLARWTHENRESLIEIRELDLKIRQIRARASGSGVALAVARERALSIECARSRLVSLHEAIGHANGRIRDIELGIGAQQSSNSALERDHARECARRLSRAVDHARALDRAVMVCRALGYVPPSYCRRSEELIKALQQARRCAPDDLAHDRDRMPAIYIDGALVIAHGIKYDLDGASWKSPTRSRRRERITARDVSRLAQRLVFMAAWLLPLEVRGRYIEEYCCELREIADSDRGLSGQLAYVSRLLVGSLPMRVALLTPRRKKALP